MATKRRTLEDFASEQVDPRSLSWADKLPQEVKAQIVESPASTRVVVRWLHSIGYPEATYSKIDHWRRQERTNARQEES